MWKTEITGVNASCLIASGCYCTDLLSLLIPVTSSLGQASFKDCRFGASIGLKQDGGWLLVTL